MSLFSQARDAYSMQKKIKKIQKELDERLVEATALDGKIVVTASAKPDLKKVEIAPELLVPERKAELEEGILRATKKALETAQKIAAELMQSSGALAGLGG